MSDQPELFPYESEHAPLFKVSPDEPMSADQPATEPVEPLPGFLVPRGTNRSIPDNEDDSPLFQQFFRPPLEPQERIPNIGHVAILGLLALCGLFGASLLARLALHFHLFGVSTITQAATEIHYTLGTEGVFYILTFAGCLLIFPIVWHKGLLEGLHWQGATAFRHGGYLVAAAIACFVLALINGMLIPGPSDAPIDRIFRMPGAAWMLFGFGVTLAPFFEEIAFRGFLLPALCTSFDWIAEKTVVEPPRQLDEDGHPRWSMPAMVIAAILTSILFAFMHADQTGYSIGPFLLLICVSLVLCWARLSTRSLAASVLVHACYNFLLFSLMFFGTSGFRHLDRM
jgi:membrane protease YdiL (CAAX protease family)